MTASSRVTSGRGEGRWMEVGSWKLEVGDAGRDGVEMLIEMVVRKGPASDLGDLRLRWLWYTDCTQTASHMHFPCRRRARRESSVAASTVLHLADFSSQAGLPSLANKASGQHLANHGTGSVQFRPRAGPLVDQARESTTTTTGRLQQQTAVRGLSYHTLQSRRADVDKRRP